MAPPTFTPGHFCWFELATSDDQASTEFYSRLFGWASETHAMGGGHGDYTMLRRDGKDAAGLYALLPEQRNYGVPSHWLSYIGVEDLDATTEKAKSLGGRCYVEPLEIPGKGRFSVLSDPTGAAFALWQAAGSDGAAVFGTPGSACYNELVTTDIVRAGEFYSQLLGWEQQDRNVGTMKYTVFQQDAVPVAGMMEVPAEAAGAPSNWMLYFAVEDCDGSAQLATEMGAQACAPPMDIPMVGRMAALIDPQSAAFAIIQLERPPS